MRNNIYLLSTVAALALAGCKTTDEAASGAALDICGLSCPAPVDDTSGSDSGSGSSDDDDTDTGVGTTGVNTTDNTGNTTKLSESDETADKAIALETSQVLVPQDSSKTNLSRVTETKDAGGNFDTAKIEIDTKTQSNSNWPPAKELELFASSNNELGGAAYREYRKRSAPLNAAVVDEELQIWTWGNSRAYQYRHVPEGGEAINQLWGYGGQKTDLAQLPTGTASFNGRFAATAKSWNWAEGGTPPVSINNLWRLNGSSQINADFATSKLTGTLTPELWNGRETVSRQFVDINANDPTDVNWKPFMNQAVSLKGTITGNTFAGKAKLPTAVWLNNENPMHGGFFGPNAAEATGVFAVTGTAPDPTGGSLPINDDGRAFLEMSGTFHAEQ